MNQHDVSENSPPPHIWQSCTHCFLDQHAILWAALSRTVNLLAVFNISLFFLTGAVKTQGYYYPIISLSLLAAAALMILMPLGLHNRLGYYLLILMLCVISGSLLGASIYHWLHS